MSRRPWWVWAGAAALALFLAVAAIRLARGESLLPFGGGDETWARIQREGVVRVGMDASYPPFELVDAAGRFSGYDVDLATALAERWGVTPVFVNIHFDGLYDALRAEKVDLIISALPYDRTLTRDVRYSGSYFNAGQVLVTPASTGISGTAHLAGRPVAVELGAEGHQLLRRLVRDEGLTVEIIPCREADEVAALLAAGQADATVCDRVTAEAYLAADPALRIVGPALTEEPYVIATRLEAPQVMAAVDAALAEWRAGGQFDAWEQRWFGAGATTP